MERVIRLRREGLSLEKIANALNAERLPTPAGRPRWTKRHVDLLLHTRHAREIAEELDQAELSEP